MILASHDPVDHVLPHRFGDVIKHWNIDYKAPLNIFSISPHDTYFTNHMLMTLVAALVCLMIFPIIGRKYAAMIEGGPDRVVPSGFSNLLEAMMQFVRNDVARPVLGDRADRFMPFLWTVFFYILICNLLGMIPLDSIVYLASGQKLQHVGGTATGNIMITAGLAFCSFVMIHLSGVIEVYRGLVSGTYGHHHHEEHGDDHGHEDHGHAGHGHEHGHHYPHGKPAATAAVMAPALYLWNFAPHVFMPKTFDNPMSYVLVIADLIMWGILLVLDAIGAIIKPFALSIRLFANMVAGHVVLGSILALIFMFKGSVAANYGLGVVASLGAAALSCLELFVCFLQAYVFTFLTTLFIGASVAPEH
ncbi:MAG: F0F1 ATP synthase subunit A [Planctomycetes bacterium]|nr:F0F1 ATP synthase subunit A [Planctomycetota bacterium]